MSRSFGQEIDIEAVDFGKGAESRALSGDPLRLHPCRSGGTIDHPMGKKRALQLAGLMAEGNAPPPALEAVPESHAALVTERLRAFDAGEVQAVPGSEVRTRLMARAVSNIRTAAEQEPDVPPATAPRAAPVRRR
jgi:hypothetical protein